MAQAELWHDDSAVTPLQPAHGHTSLPLLALPPHVVHATPPFDDIDLDNDHNEDTPLCFRRMDNVLGPAQVPGLAQRVLQEKLHAVSAEEPAMLEEAVRDPSWHATMAKELCSIEENCTSDVVALSAGHQPISLKWVYKSKKDENGHVVKLKARLVVKGFVQKQGVDFEEVFAPMARMESVRLILAVAAHEDW
jgi:hypothetical protein